MRSPCYRRYFWKMLQRKRGLRRPGAADRVVSAIPPPRGKQMLAMA